METEGEVGHLQAKVRDSRRNQPCHYLVPRFLPSRTMRKQFLFLDHLQSMAVCYGSPRKQVHSNRNVECYITSLILNIYLGRNLILKYTGLDARNYKTLINNIVSFPKWPIDLMQFLSKSQQKFLELDLF